MKPYIKASRAGWRNRVLVCAVVAVYLLLATHLITLPGIYMDAVNPDYLAVKLLNKHHESPLVAWVLPGNYLMGNRFPVLVSMYHGMQQLWLGLPLYALLGTGVSAIRLVHAAFGAGVLLGLCGLLRAAKVSPHVWALAATALATDPAFLYAFRTQSYITLAPVAWLLLSLSCLLLKRPNEYVRVALSGLFFGLSVLGYFIYAFFAPAMLLALFHLRSRSSSGEQRPASSTAVLGSWVLGIVFGCAYYVWGYALLARAEGGIAGLYQYFLNYQSRLQVLSTPLSWLERVEKSWELLYYALTNSWNHAMIFGALEPLPFSGIKLLAILIFPTCVYVALFMRGERNFVLGVLIALFGSFFGFSLIFGDRLGGHHFIALLPIAYGGLAVGAGRMHALAGSAARFFVVRLIPATVLGSVIMINCAGQAREFGLLEQTGGVGLFSDAINRFADDLNNSPVKPLVVMPDWGLALPVTMLTAGTVATLEMVDVASVTRALCAGRDVTIALISGDRTARIARWQQELGWSAPIVKHYRQRDDTIVFDTVTFLATDRTGRCQLASQPRSGH